MRNPFQAWDDSVDMWPLSLHLSCYHANSKAGQQHSYSFHFQESHDYTTRDHGIWNTGIPSHQRRSNCELFSNYFTVFTAHVWYLVALVRLVHQDPVCGLGGRAGYRAAYRHRGIQESTQGASHASQPPLSLVKPWTRHIVKTSNNRQKSVLS